MVEADLRALGLSLDENMSQSSKEKATVRRSTGDAFS
jgi:hypothetical protein